MGNDAATAKLEADKNFCRLSDIEVGEKGIDVISTVDDDGSPNVYKETYKGEAYIAYYYCTNCAEVFGLIEFKTQENMWAKVKEHLNGTL